jgi:hypothetical protein
MGLPHDLPATEAYQEESQRIWNDDQHMQFGWFLTFVAKADAMRDELLDSRDTWRRAALAWRKTTYEAEERWIWVAHMVWAIPDPHPASARSYPLRLAQQWHPGLSYHDGRFYDAAHPDAEEHTCCGREGLVKIANVDSSEWECDCYCHPEVER